MKLINQTGKHPLVPECPKHKGIALIPENRPITGGEASGFWRCPTDNAVYMEDSIRVTKYEN